MMKKSFVFWIALAILMAGPAMASTLPWSIAGNGISGSGTWTLGTETASGVFAITAMDGIFDDVNNAISGSVTFPYPAATGGTLTSPDGLYYYDNLLFKTGSLLFDSTGGLLFNVGGTEVNIAGIGNGYQLWESIPNGPTYLPNSSVGYEVSVESVPEPATFGLVAVAAMLLAYKHRRQVGVR